MNPEWPAPTLAKDGSMERPITRLLRRAASPQTPEEPLSRHLLLAKAPLTQDGEPAICPTSPVPTGSPQGLGTTLQTKPCLAKNLPARERVCFTDKVNTVMGPWLSVKQRLGGPSGKPREDKARAPGWT